LLFFLDRACLKVNDIDAVVFYEKPFLKFDRILNSTLKKYPDSEKYFNDTIKVWFRDKKFEVKERILGGLNIQEDKIHFVEHHKTHAASAFFCSPFAKSTIVTIDGVGEYETLTVSKGNGIEIEKVYSQKLPNSLGLFYTAFTAFLGFKINIGEYKLMGMSGFGKPLYKDLLRNFFELKSDGTFEIKQDCFNFLCPEKLPFNQNLINMIGRPRKPESSFDIGIQSDNPTSIQKMSCHYANIAASVQQVTEEVILHVVKNAVKRIGFSDVSMAGGVALNSLANGKLQKELKGRLYVHPAAGDSGGALGAALYFNHCIKKKPRYKELDNLYLGKEYSESEILKFLNEENITSYEKFSIIDDLLTKVAEKLSKGSVIGWFQGRFEWGPRALGARSIIADPSRKDIKSIVNEKIKFREPFRPFAPAVLAEKANDFFDIPEPYSFTCPEHFMLAIANVHREKRSIIPSVTHVDGTARVQLVQKRVNPLFYELIKKFEKIKGIPMLLNTSFNLRVKRRAYCKFTW